MKKIIPYVLIAASSFAAVSLHAQTADEIVNKYIDALGGRDVISKVTSLYMVGSSQVMGGENPTTTTIVDGKGYKNETDFNGQKIVQCVTDKGGWAINPMGGGGAEAMPDEAYKASRSQLYIAGSLYNYAAKGSTVESQGKDGKNFKLKLVTSDKSETTYYIDAATYYISKVVRKGSFGGQEVEITIQFSDYKKTDSGFVVPYTYNLDLGQFQVATTYTKIEVNKTIDPTVFDMPK